MKKVFYNIFFSLLILVPLCGISQDNIYFVDDKRVQAKIIAIDSNLVKYKKTENPEGPFYLVSRENIMLIIYENGQYVSFRKKSRLFKDTEDTLFSFKHPLLTFHPLDLALGRVMFSLECFTDSGRFSLRFPLSIGFKDISFISGLDFNFYTTGQNKFSHFIGAKFRTGYVLYDDFFNDDGLFTLIMLNNGLRYNFNEHISLSAEMGIGVNAFKLNEIRSSGGLNFGYRF